MRIYAVLLIIFALTLQGFASSSMAMSGHLVSQEKQHPLSMTLCDNALVQESVSITSYPNLDKEQAVNCCCSDHSSYITNTVKNSQQCEHECDHCDQWHNASAVLISCYFELNQSKSEPILDRTLDPSSILLTGLSPPP